MVNRSVDLFWGVGFPIKKDKEPKKVDWPFFFAKETEGLRHCFTLLAHVELLARLAALARAAESKPSCFGRWRRGVWKLGGGCLMRKLP